MLRYLRHIAADYAPPTLRRYAAVYMPPMPLPAADYAGAADADMMMLTTLR